MNVMAAVSLEDQWSYVKTEYLRGKLGKEIHENLCNACGNNALSFKTVYRWLARFSAGKTYISDEVCSCCRPHEAKDPYHIEKVKEVLDEDRRLTCDEVAESVRISHGSAHEIITLHLKMRWIAARWVRHFLTCDQMQERVRLAEEHINRHKKEGKTFLNCIIDKTWLLSYEPVKVSTYKSA